MLRRGYGGPLRYAQGPGVLADLGSYAAGLGRTALLIMDAFVEKTYGDMLRRSLAQAGVETVETIFGGESTDAEVTRCAELGAGRAVVIGVGGGKTLDTAKIAARDTNARMITVPTIASTDSPTSSLGVIYSEQGVYVRVERCYRNPDVVLVDSALIVAAPVRFLISGMGDALSTWFEAEDCHRSGATNMTGRVGSMTALALARLCFDTLLAHGIAAKASASRGHVDASVDKIIEANTLLSGLGFESGGLSGAHAIHNGLTALAPTHRFWHGEKVAIGTQALLFLTGRSRETIAQVFDFCLSVGLPTQLADIGLEAPSDAELMTVAELACAPGETIHNAPVEVTPQKVFEAIKAADAHGRHLNAKHAVKAA